MSGHPDEVIQLDGQRGDPLYHAIRLDPQGGVEATLSVQARTDEEALAAVRAMDGRNGIDLWDRNRLVASVAPVQPLHGA